MELGSGLGLGLGSGLGLGLGFEAGCARRHVAEEPDLLTRGQLHLGWGGVGGVPGVAGVGGGRIASSVRVPSMVSTASTARAGGVQGCARLRLLGAAHDEPEP